MRLAYEAAVLDNMTQGRFVLGVGLGQQPVASLFDLGHTSLGDHADEVLSQVRELWTSGTILPCADTPNWSDGRAHRGRRPTDRRDLSGVRIGSSLDACPRGLDHLGREQPSVVSDCVRQASLHSDSKAISGSPSFGSIDRIENPPRKAAQGTESPSVVVSEEVRPPFESTAPRARQVLRLGMCTGAAASYRLCRRGTPS